MDAYLVLEDGTVFSGRSCGAEGENFGEVVFNTSMTGYQEIITDPSYYGQILTMTYPLIGNYGINIEDNQSFGPKIWGFAAKEISNSPHNWRMKHSLRKYLEDHDIVAVENIDTRALTRRIRDRGTMLGAIGTGVPNSEQLLEKMLENGPQGSELVPAVTTKEPLIYENSGPKVVVLDFGIKENIWKSLYNLGCHIVILPARSSFKEVLSYKPEGVILSNGPGDPKDVLYGAQTAKELIGEVPLFGICLGHQLLAIALGGDTYKLPFGHRGANHPVKDTETGKVYITSQNHGYAVDSSSLPKDLRVTHLNLNDETVEGLKHEQLPIFSVQYHPEFSPGPVDSFYIFQEFLDLL